MTHLTLWLLVVHFILSIDMLGSILSSVAAGGAKGLLSLGDTMLTNYFNRKAWSRMMEAANTAHRREVRDLRAAGLNPILSATGGNGSSTPSLGGVDADLSSAADTAIDAFSAKKSAENQGKQADAALISANASKVSSDAQKVNSEAQKKNADTNQWQIYTAEEMGSAGFKAQLGFKAGGEGHIRTVRTIRVNKVTGETYDALTGDKIRIIDEIPLSSAKQVISPSAEYKPVGKPIVIDDDDIKSFYQRQKRNAPPWRVTR